MSTRIGCPQRDEDMGD